MSTTFSIVDAPMAKDRTEGWRYIRSFGDVFEAPDGQFYLTSADAVQYAYSHPEIFSSATDCVLRWMLTPSLTKASNTLPPSSCALEKAPRPASQICWAESLTELAKGEPASVWGLDFCIFVTMGNS